MNRASIINLTGSRTSPAPQEKEKKNKAAEDSGKKSSAHKVSRSARMNALLQTFGKIEDSSSPTIKNSSSPTIKASSSSTEEHPITFEIQTMPDIPYPVQRVEFAEVRGGQLVRVDRLSENDLTGKDLTAEHLAPKDLAPQASAPEDMAPKDLEEKIVAPKHARNLSDLVDSAGGLSINRDEKSVDWRASKPGVAKERVQGGSSRSKFNGKRQTMYAASPVPRRREVPAPRDDRMMSVDEVLLLDLTPGGAPSKPSKETRSSWVVSNATSDRRSMTLTPRFLASRQPENSSAETQQDDELTFAEFLKELGTSPDEQ